MLDTIKPIRVLDFDNSRSKFRMWSMKFLTAGHARGYRELLSGTVQPPPSHEVIDETTDEGKKEKKLRGANQKASSDLVLSCSAEISFEIVVGATTENLPGVDARLAWGKLNKKKMPITSANKVDLVAQFANSKQDSWKKNPDNWISKLEILRSRLSDQ